MVYTYYYDYVISYYILFYSATLGAGHGRSLLVSASGSEQPSQPASIATCASWPAALHEGICIYIYIYTCMYICIYVHMYICLSLSLYIYIYTYTCVCMYISISIYLYITYAQMYTFMFYNL